MRASTAGERGRSRAADCGSVTSERNSPPPARSTPREIVAWLPIAARIDLPDWKDLPTMKEATGKDHDKDWARQGQAWDAFVNEMWAQHRATLPAATAPSRTGGGSFGSCSRRVSTCCRNHSDSCSRAPRC